MPERLPDRKLSSPIHAQQVEKASNLAGRRALGTEDTFPLGLEEVSTRAKASFEVRAVEKLCPYRRDWNAVPRCLPASSAGINEGDNLEHDLLVGDLDQHFTSVKPDDSYARHRA